MRRVIVIGISILSVFILCSLSFQPIIADTPIEVEEITVNIFGLNRQENQKLTISKEDSERIDLIFDDLRNKLGKSETIEETIKIYNGALAELDNIDFLGEILRYLLKQFISRIYGRRYLISGQASNSGFVSPEIYILSNIFYFSEFFADDIFGFEVGAVIHLLFILYSLFALPVNTLIYLFPLHIRSNGIIYFSSEYITPSGGPKPSTQRNTAKGWIDVRDKLGFITDKSERYNGTLHGDLSKFYLGLGIWFGVFKVGIMGFNGIGIKSGGKLNFIGTASLFAV